RAHRGFDLFFRDRPLLQRTVEARAQLARVERLAPTIGLDDHRQLQLDRLQRAEALATGLTYVAPADGRAIVRHPRVDHAGVGVLAEGAMQRVSPAAAAGSAVHRELAALRGDRVAHAGDHRLVPGRVEHVAQPVGELDAVGLLVAAGGHRGGADAQA